MATATVSRMSFARIWMTTYPSLLESATGRLVTRNAYASVFNQRPSNLRLPWDEERENRHWNRFWACYLGAPGRVRSLSADSAWERVIPFRWLHASTIEASDDLDAIAHVLVYPAAITVIIRVAATGEWPLDQVASHLSTLRKRKDWEVARASGVSAGRSLDGIATELRDEAEGLLTNDGAPEPGAQQVSSVAAPLAAEGEVASLELTQETAKACLAGLASLGPPGTLQEDRLLKPNSDSNLAARMYVLREGHAIWHPANMINQPDSDPIGCLFTNHTALVTHISALSGIVSWANQRIGERVAIPNEIQILVKLAALRLNQLYKGDKAKTYRSELAKMRVEALQEDLSTIAGAL